ncbi:hypothetical protein IFR05_001549 [Cadophora sp. M221]|nr:hypothetical protein IFR05_001549 [Cadophora sp. M221]
MRPGLVFFVEFVEFASTVRSLGFWADKSCGSAFDDGLVEAVTIARNANIRLTSETDTDFERVIERIFSFQRTDAASLKKLKDVTTCIGDLTSEPSRKKADIRFYCDNDLVKAENNAGRWEPRPNGLKGFVILHELTHIPSCKALDQPIGNNKGPLAYGWEKSIALPTEKAILNSDNYAFLGTFAWLASPIMGKPTLPGEVPPPVDPNAFKVKGGYSLPRPSQTDYEIQAEKGTLYHYKDITKRALLDGVKAARFVGCAIWDSTGKHCLESRA